MRKALLVVLSLAGLCSAAGCGSSDDSELGSGSGVAIEDTPKLVAAAACGALDACWGASSALVFGAEDCKQRLETQFQEAIDELSVAKANGTAFYDGQKFQACLDAIAAAKCDIDAALESEVCRSAVDGLMEIGKDCSSDLECKGDAYCKSSGACPGTCTAGGSDGVACQINDECAVGFYCSESDKQCTKPALAGDVCGGASSPKCDEGFFCLGEDDDTGQSGNCRAFDEVFTAKVGEVCNPSAALCEPGAHCGIMNTAPLELECIAPVASGAACRVAFPEACPGGEYCNVVPDTLEGTCTVLPSAGEACVTGPVDQAQLCAPYTRCDNGTCLALQKLGGTCSADTTCYSEFCSGSVCAPAGSCG